MHMISHVWNAHVQRRLLVLGGKCKKNSKKKFLYSDGRQSNHHHGSICFSAAPAGNRTRISRVTGGDTNRYTTEAIAYLTGWNAGVEYFLVGGGNGRNVNYKLQILSGAFLSSSPTQPHNNQVLKSVLYGLGVVLLRRRGRWAVGKGRRGRTKIYRRFFSAVVFFSAPEPQHAEKVLLSSC